MGEAKRRGTPEQRKAEGEAKAQAIAAKKAEERAEADKQRRKEWASLTPKQKDSRLLLAAMLAMTASMQPEEA